MNTMLMQSEEGALALVPSETPNEIEELQIVELAYVGGGMANVSFV